MFVSGTGNVLFFGGNFLYTEFGHIEYQKACTRLRSLNVAEAIRCGVFFVSTGLVGDLIEVIGIECTVIIVNMYINIYIYAYI